MSYMFKFRKKLLKKKLFVLFYWIQNYKKKYLVSSVGSPPNYYNSEIKAFFDIKRNWKCLIRSSIIKEKIGVILVRGPILKNLTLFTNRTKEIETLISQ